MSSSIVPGEKVVINDRIRNVFEMRLQKIVIGEREFSTRDPQHERRYLVLMTQP